MRKIRSFIKKFIISLLPKSIIAGIIHKYFGEHNIFYSQEGEDIILGRIFEGRTSGFYVDIGSHHPVRFSNTHAFYLKGWNGINVDATPGSMLPFKTIRPRDINIEVGISKNEGEMKYYIMDEPALNTFSRERAEYLQANTPYRLKNTVSVKTKTLQQIMAEHVPVNQKIDFLTIDVEGLDFEILFSNDWKKYRPSVILAEDLNSSLENIGQSETYKFLKSNGYELFSRTYNTIFFRDALHQ